MSESSSKRAFIWVALIVVLALILNVVLALFSSGGGEFFTLLPDKMPSSLLAVEPIDDERTVIATLDNEIIVTDGSSELAKVTLDTTVGDVAYVPATSEIMAGGSNGVVYIFDENLQQVGEGKVKGRVLGLAATSDGNIAVSHGVGAYGDRFYVSVLTSAGEEIYTFQAGIPVNAVDAVGAQAVYGTDDARVSRLDENGNQLWLTLVRRSITEVRGWTEHDQVLVGDAKGNVSLLDGEGNLVWELNPTQFPIGVVEPLGDDLVLIGDKEGAIFLVDAQGQLLLTQSSETERDTIVALYARSDGKYVAIRQGGEVLLIDPEAQAKAQRADTLRPVWVWGDVLLVLLGAVALIRAIDPWRRAAAVLLVDVYEARMAYLFLVPSLILLAIFFYYTVGTAGYYSLTNFIPGRPTRFVGLENFIQIFTHDRYFWLGMGNMLRILITSTIKVLTVPLFVALLVFHLRSSRGRYIFRTAVLLPTVVPAIVITMMWKMMYDPNIGFFNTLLQSIGLPQWQQAWLGNEKSAIWAIIFAGFPWVGAFGFLVYLGGLINVNPELFDAAALDGCGSWDRLRHIEWPLVSAQRNLLLFFTYLGAIQGYAGIWVYTQGGPGHATYVPALQLFLTLSQSMEIGYSSAIGFVLFAMVLLVTFIQRRMQARQQMA